jgi:hypothetical protein
MPIVDIVIDSYFTSLKHVKRPRRQKPWREEAA